MGSIIELLRSLAYDANLFPQVSLLLARFVMVAPPDYNYNSARRSFMNLFQLRLSGTHATIEQRLQVVNSLIQNEDTTSQSCGLNALSKLLEAGHFSGHNFDFGARPRDYGLYPTSTATIAGWYRATITYAQPLALLNGSVGEQARSMLASQFRSLWRNIGMVDDLKSLVRAVVAQHFWSEEWLAVRATIHFDSKNMLPEHAIRLRTLEQILRPRELLETIRAYVFSKGWNVLDIDEEADDAGAGFGSGEATIESLGRECAANPDVLHILLPDLVRSNATGSRSLKRFGFVSLRRRTSQRSTRGWWYSHNR